MKNNKEKMSPKKKTIKKGRLEKTQNKQKLKDEMNTSVKSVKFAPNESKADDEQEVKHEKRSKKRKIIKEVELPTEEELTESKKPENVKDVTSKRQIKRLKYEKLKADNKLKQEAMHQEKSLNYLSKWKHSRTEWKFEKLKQIWLKNHMFDSTALPEEFFPTLIEYFEEAKGEIRQILINECTKIIDEGITEEDDENTIKFNRAKTLLQNLKE